MFETDDYFTARVNKAIKHLEQQSSESVEINLSGEQMSDDALVALCSSLGKNTTVESLSLTWCRVSDDGMQMLADALKTNRRLTRLDVYGNRNSNRGSKTLFASIATNKHLRAIDVDIDVQNVESFNDMLAANDTLSTIRLFLVPTSQDNDREAGFLKLYSAIGSNPNLRGVVFVAEPRSSWLQSKETDALASLIRTNRCLTSLHLYGYPDDKKIRDAVEWNWSLLTFNMPRDNAFRNSIRERNRSLQWRLVQPKILDICVAMAPLQLPPYVLLWIIDWLPFYEAAVSHHKKIALIENINNSCVRIYERREETPAAPAVSTTTN